MGSNLRDDERRRIQEAWQRNIDEARMSVLSGVAPEDLMRKFSGDAYDALRDLAREDRERDFHEHAASSGIPNADGTVDVLWMIARHLNEERTP